MKDVLSVEMGDIVVLLWPTRLAHLVQHAKEFHLQNQKYLDESKCSNFLHLTFSVQKITKIY